MIENSWSNKLSQEPKTGAILSLPRPTIVYQTHANQLIAHSQTESTSLPIRRDILCVQALNTTQVLLLSRYQLSCFDLLNNNEIFSLQFENARNLFVENCFIYVVCGSDLFCYDQNGEEQYVNHCSALIETVTSIELKGTIQVVVGLNDITMVRYRSVNISLDYGKIIGVPSSICWIGDGVLVGTQEGTVAYYEGKKSKWKAKSHHPVLKVLAYQGESSFMAIIGRKDGLVQVKDWRGKGETIHKLKLHEDLVGLLVYDFREEKNDQLVCLLKSGKVTGLNVHQEAKKAGKHQIAEQIKLEQQSWETLQNQKLSLEFQITELKQKIESGQINKSDTENEHILKSDFNFQTTLHHEKEGLGLTIQCFNGFISGLTFEEPILPEIYDRLASVKYIFKAQNLVFGEINCFAQVHSTYTSKIYEGRGFKITLPKFWKFGSTTEQQNSKIEGGIRFKCFQRNARYIKWIIQCFFVNWTEEEKGKLESSGNLQLKYYNSYDKIALEFNFKTKDGSVQIYCDCIKTLGQIFQDLVQYIGVQELDSQLWFPKEKPKLMSTLTIIQKLSQVKVSISSQMAEAIENIKFMLVKGQSARVVGSMRELRRTYTDIMGFNRNLITEIEKKNQNTKLLSESLKVLGQLINQTANVRFGKVKEQMIKGCREAIKRKEFPKIIAIMERGVSSL